MKLCSIAELSPFRICQLWLFTKFVLIGNELYDAISSKDDFTRNFPRTPTLAPEAVLNVVQRNTMLTYILRTIQMKTSREEDGELILRHRKITNFKVIKY